MSVGGADGCLQVRAERLYDREDDASRRRQYGVARHVVEDTVGVGLLVVVEPVEVHHLQEGLLLDVAHRQVGGVGTGRVVLVVDVETEIFLLYLVGAQRVDVFHHQVPNRFLVGDGRAFQHLDVEALFGVGDVGRKLSHLVGLSVLGVLKGHGKHLVARQLAVERGRNRAGC